MKILHGLCQWLYSYTIWFLWNAIQYEPKFHINCKYRALLLKLSYVGMSTDLPSPIKAQVLNTQVGCTVSIIYINSMPVHVKYYNYHTSFCSSKNTAVILLTYISAFNVMKNNWKEGWCKNVNLYNSILNNLLKYFAGCQVDVYWSYIQEFLVFKWDTSSQ